MVETLFKLGCLMLCGCIAFAYLLVSFEDRASATATKTAPVGYTTVSKNAAPKKEKNCSCCEERKEQARRLMERRRKMVQQAQKRARTEQSVTNVSITQ